MAADLALTEKEKVAEGEKVQNPTNLKDMCQRMKSQAIFRSKTPKPNMEICIQHCSLKYRQDYNWVLSNFMYIKLANVMVYQLQMQTKFNTIFKFLSSWYITLYNVVERQKAAEAEQRRAVAEKEREQVEQESRDRQSMHEVSQSDNGRAPLHQI